MVPASDQAGPLAPVGMEQEGQREHETAVDRQTAETRHGMIVDAAPPGLSTAPRRRPAKTARAVSTTPVKPAARETGPRIPPYLQPLHLHLPHFVPKRRSPASPSPGTM